MKKIFILLIISLLGGANLNCQTDTVYNQVNEKGMKEGYWRKFYPNGKLMYQGYFENNLPRGIMKRYFKSGNLQAILNFGPEGKEAMVQLFYEDGERSASGKFVNMQKDSIWKYYSFYSGALVSEEFFVAGKKHGVQKNYFANGKISEEMEYKNNIKDGTWKQYFEDGKVKVKATYRWNRLNGRYTFYYPTGIMMMVGTYDEGKKDGPWVYYDNDGNEKYRINYFMDRIDPEDKKMLLEKDAEFFKNIEENIGKFEEPTIEDFFRAPR